MATSQTTSNNPRGNGQCEKYNDIIWKAILGALKPRRLSVTHWELVMTDALHSIRSLLCSSIDCTHHERMFCHSRRSVSGMSLPSWLKPCPVYVERLVRNKGDSFVEKHNFWTSILITLVSFSTMVWKLLFLQYKRFRSVLWGTKCEN